MEEVVERVGGNGGGSEGSSVCMEEIVKGLGSAWRR